MTAPIVDTYFLDWRDALRTAEQGNRVPLTIAATGSQICYYDGDAPVPETPTSMVHVPLDRVAEFFSESDLRRPAAISFPKEYRDTRKIPEVIDRLKRSLAEAERLRRQKILRHLIAIHGGPAPEPDPGRPLRILLPTSRYTTVLQYSSLGLARAFERLGHRVMYFIERDDMMSLTGLELLRAIQGFRPDLIIHINSLHNQLVHPRAIVVSWWQDPVPEITRGDPLPWRPRDLVYIIARHPFEEFIARTGLARERIRVQSFCIDTDVFHARGGPARERKIVFVGSSARRGLLGTREERTLIEALTARILKGEPLVQRDIDEAAERSGVPKAHAYFKVHHYLIRDLPVRWLCRQSEIPVEIYGRHWQEDEIVAPFFRGEVPHGPAVAEIYRGARYALSCHSQLIQNQRLAEAASCGCIPIVFDCRHCAEPPHWEENCLFFRTPGDLLECLHRDAPLEPERFQEHYSYDRFAWRILSDARALCEAAVAPAPPAGSLAGAR